MDTEEKKLNDAMQERFKKLPKVVQDAITSADVEKHLRALSDKHKLHLDQWSLLENEVMLALLGFEKIDDIAKNIQSEVGMDAAAAAALAEDISKIVFEPIRGELERRLDHPQAVATQTTGVEDARTQMLASPENKPAVTPAPTVAPATPPQPAPTAKVERTPATAPTYAPNVASHERKTIEGDPYREPLL